jgi:hypothetical protein
MVSTSPSEIMMNGANGAMVASQIVVKFPPESGESCQMFAPFSLASGLRNTLQAHIYIYTYIYIYRHTHIYIHMISPVYPHHIPVTTDKNAEVKKRLESTWRRWPDNWCLENHR